MKICLKKLSNHYLLLPLLFLMMHVNSVEGGVVIDRIVALVGQEIITQSDIDEMRQSARLSGQTEVDAREILGRLIEERLILEEARKKGIRVSSAELEFALQDIQTRNQFPNREVFKRAVISGNLIWSQYVADLEMQLLTLKLLGREAGASTKVSEEALRSYYETHAEKFVLPPRIRLRRLLFRLPLTPTDEEQKQLEEKVDTVLLELSQGTAFEKLIERYNGSNKRKGDLGFLSKGELSSEIEKVVFSLNEGEVSPPVVMPTGVQFFKLVTREEGLRSPFEKVRQEIEGRLMMEKRQAFQTKWLNRLWEQTFVEIK